MAKNRMFVSKSSSVGPKSGSVSFHLSAANPGKPNPTLGRSSISSARSHKEFHCGEAPSPQGLLAPWSTVTKSHGHRFANTTSGKFVSFTQLCFEAAVNLSVLHTPNQHESKALNLRSRSSKSVASDPKIMAGFVDLQIVRTC